MKNSGKSQNSMRAVTINCDFSLPGLNKEWASEASPTPCNYYDLAYKIV